MRLIHVQKRTQKELRYFYGIGIANLLASLSVVSSQTLQREIFAVRNNLRLPESIIVIVEYSINTQTNIIDLNRKIISS